MSATGLIEIIEQFSKDNHRRVRVRIESQPWGRERELTDPCGTASESVLSKRRGGGLLNP